MAAGLNRVVLVGRLTRTPELKRTTSGAAVTAFTIAVDNNRTSGENNTCFINCKCWNKTAENVAKFCTKGLLVGVDGRLSQNNYVDKNGQNRSSFEVIADSVQFLERKGAVEESETEHQGEEDVNKGTVAHEGIDSSDDDLPF